MAVMTAMDTQPAFREGYRAYTNAAFPDENPYPPGSDFDWWYKGWLTAEQEDDIRLGEYEMNAAGAAPDVNL